jgi:hypothetical protein
VHVALARRINPEFNPALYAEYVLLKPMPGPSPDKIRRGMRDTIALDIYEQVSDDTVCIYDAKTGKRGLSGPRMQIFSDSVAKKLIE